MGENQLVTKILNMTTDYKVTEFRSLPFALEASYQSHNMRKQYCR